MYTYNYWGINTLSGQDNMALEELFYHQAAQDKTAHIRFYDFTKDTVVLGYNQATDALKTWNESFNVIRRPSGGSHVHVGQNTLAYSFIVPNNGSFRNHQDFRIYFADHVARALERIGLEDITTDHKASTIMQNGKVIASHAVTWGGKSALLHGLVMIDPCDVQKIIQRVYLGYRTIGGNTYYEAAALAQIPTLTGLLTAKPNATQEQRSQYFKQIMAEAILQEVAGQNYERQELTEKLLHAARTFRDAKYSQDKWIKHRDPEFTKEEVEELPGEKINGPLKKGWGYCLYIQVPDKDFKKMANPD